MLMYDLISIIKLFLGSNFHKLFKLGRNVCEVLDEITIIKEFEKGVEAPFWSETIL